MSVSSNFDLSQVLFAGFDPSNTRGIAMLHVIAHAYRGIPPEKIPSLSDIVERVKTNGSFRLADKQRIEKDSLSDLVRLQRMIDGIAQIDIRHRLGPANGSRQ